MSDTNRTRVISGVCLVAILIFCTLLGGIAVLFLSGIISFIGLGEYMKAAGIENRLLVSSAKVLALLYLPGLYFLGERVLLPFIVLVFLYFGICAVLKFPEIPFRDFTCAVAGLIYLTVFSGFLYLIRVAPQGIFLFILVFLCSWLGDTFGYAVGRRIGKHRMTPVLSPKKSWEGLVAELVGVTAAAFVYGFLFQDRMTGYHVPALACFICGLFGSILSVFGDLFASAIKREYGIKDYGNLIPGHGGILDRFDSVLFTAPFVYLVFYLLKV